MVEGAKELAVEMSRLSAGPFFVGAVLFSKRRIISMGHNKARKTHPKARNPYQRIHAELDALLKAGTVAGLDIVVARTSKTQKLLSMARPCAFCMGLLHEYGVHRITYSTGDARVWMSEGVATAFDSRIG